MRPDEQPRPHAAGDWRSALSRIMQGLQFRYTGSFNRKYKKVGHLFEGRYKAILCDRDAYLLELVRYLHLNPQRMRSPMQAATYRWSCHGAYLGKDNLVRIDTAPVLGEFAKSLGKARMGYLRFMAASRCKSVESVNGIRLVFLDLIEHCIDNVQ
jgi:hypothetical protein